MGPKNVSFVYSWCSILLCYCSGVVVFCSLIFSFTTSRRILVYILSLFSFLSLSLSISQHTLLIVALHTHTHTHTHYFVIHNNNNGLLLGFNAAKNYQLGWYNLQKESYNPVDYFDKKRTFVMNGMTEYNKNEGASKDTLITLRLENKRNDLDDYYIGKEKVIVVSHSILFVWMVGWLGFFCSVVVVFFHFCLSFLAYYNMQSLLTHICFFTNHTKIKDIIVRLVLIVERMKLEIRLLYYKNQ